MKLPGSRPGEFREGQFRGSIGNGELMVEEVGDPFPLGELGVGILGEIPASWSEEIQVNKSYSQICPKVSARPSVSSIFCMARTSNQLPNWLPNSLQLQPNSQH